MKKYATLLLISIFALSSCKKDEPIAEIDQEEIGTAEITFTEVKAEIKEGHYIYSEINNPEVETIKFAGEPLLSPNNEPTVLKVGKSYRFTVIIKDFAGRQTQQSFIEKDDQHFAFILGMPDEKSTVTYHDKKQDNTIAQVGIQGYITVLEETSDFTTRYVMRHLNPGVKEKLNPAVDWSNNKFETFTGSSDLDLKFMLRFITNEKAQ